MNTLIFLKILRQNDVKNISEMKLDETLLGTILLHLLKLD